MITLILNFAFLVVFSFAPQNTSIIDLHIHEAKSDEGLVRILVFDSEKGYPDQPDQALRSYSIPLKDGKCNLKITDLKPGTYAICVIHDADGNGKLNTNPVGYPTEKYGFSNNARAYFSAPAFSKAAFELKHETKQIRIQLR
jgi:uncharacterized protein (DUF2141 family)